MTDLLPCPFCGDPAWMHTSTSCFADAPTGHRIECEGHCHAMTCYWHTKKEAIKAWNTRKEKAISEPKQCDVCEAREATFRSPLLGSDDALCHTCFCIWYEGGVTDRAEMKKRSLEGPAP